MPVVSKDNLDLQIRRKRLGLRQRDIAVELKVAISAISDFENGDRAEIAKPSMHNPHGLGRADYEAILRRHEKAGGSK